MNTPKDPAQPNPTLGPAKQKERKPEPDWKAYKPGIEVNTRTGQLRTVPR